MPRYGIRQVRIVVCRHRDKEYDSGKRQYLQDDLNPGALQVVKNWPARPHRAALYAIARLVIGSLKHAGMIFSWRGPSE